MRIVHVFVFVSGAMLVAVRLEKHKAAPRNGRSINGCAMGLRGGSNQNRAPFSVVGVTEKDYGETFLGVQSQR